MAANVPLIKKILAIIIWTFSAAIYLVILDFESSIRIWLPIGIITVLVKTIRGRPRHAIFLNGLISFSFLPLSTR